MPFDLAQTLRENLSKLSFSPQSVNHSGNYFSCLAHPFNTSFGCHHSSSTLNPYHLLYHRQSKQLL
jgi:hypothetical protein